MSTQSIASLSLKLFGLYCIVESMPLLQASLVAPVIQDSNLNSSLPLLIGATSFPFVLLFGLGAFLFFRSGRLAAGWFPVLESVETFNLDEFQAIAFSVVGAFVFISAIPGLAQITTNFIILNSSFDSESSNRAPALLSESASYLRKNWAFLAATLLRLILGSLFFSKSRKIVRYWKSVQSEPGANN